uniref:hypothetical protein n=1 Tax=Pantoea sp. IMH TaxID=1267600 RepID=UPI00046AEC1B|nr:hypothetical protein [Pantoea sp. IMH]
MNGIKVIIAGLLTSWMSSAMAAETAIQNGSGTMRFQGAVTETSCEMDQQRNQVNATCYRNGKRQTASLPLDSRQALPANVGSTEVRWLNEAHTMGELIVSYK